MRRSLSSRLIIIPSPKGSGTLVLVKVVKSKFLSKSDGYKVFPKFTNSHFVGNVLASLAVVVRMLEILETVEETVGKMTMRIDLTLLDLTTAPLCQVSETTITTILSTIGLFETNSVR